MLETSPVRTGQDATIDQGVLAAMELLVVAFFAVILIASIAGLPVDSRDGADWSPTSDGVRQPRRP
jgi:hypothetical protein